MNLNQQSQEYKGKTDVVTEFSKPIQNLEEYYEVLPKTSSFKDGLYKDLYNRVEQTELKNYLTFTRDEWNKLEKAFREEVEGPCKVMLIHQRDHFNDFQKLLSREKLFNQWKEAKNVLDGSGFKFGEKWRTVPDQTQNIVKNRTPTSEDLIYQIRNMFEGPFNLYAMLFCLLRNSMVQKPVSPEIASFLPFKNFYVPSRSPDTYSALFKNWIFNIAFPTAAIDNIQKGQYEVAYWMLENHVRPIASGTFVDKEAYERDFEGMMTDFETYLHTKNKINSNFYDTRKAYFNSKN